MAELKPVRRGDRWRIQISRPDYKPRLFGWKARRLLRSGLEPINTYPVPRESTAMGSRARAEIGAARSLSGYGRGAWRNTEAVHIAVQENWTSAQRRLHRQ